MDPKKALDTLQKLGLPIAPRTLVLLLLLLPIALAVGAWLWKRRTGVGKLRGWPKHANAPSAQAPASLQGGQLRATWSRFMRTLPGNYRRSILSFDHFVVLGDAASGKSQVIDTYTDWRRQAKQFLGSHVFDSNLDLYIGSRTVVTEVAAAVLNDIGPTCRTALRRLWVPLYRKCAPTVVVVLDMERLKSPDFDLVDHAERLRGKINLLSSICKRQLEVRVVLTHLDANPGWQEFAELAGAEKIPLFIPVTDQAEPPIQEQLETWVVRARDHLSRALVKGGADTLRRCVGFLRATQAFPKPLSKFFEVFIAEEALSFAPRLGGVYLAATNAAAPSPLQGRAPDSHAPDPRLRHRLAAFVSAALVLSYLSAAFALQRRDRVAASAALANYVPVTHEEDADRTARETIIAFACEGCGTVARVPDFFRNARVELRKRFSDRVRSELLIPNLRKVARDGFVLDSTLALRARRALFYLALVHGDRSDALHIVRDHKRIQAWSDMTELASDVIGSYLTTTDDAYTEAVNFELPSAHDPHDLAPYWLSLMSDVSKRLSEAQAIGAEELQALQLRASDAAQALKRFEHDELVEEILSVLLSADSRNPLAHHTRYKLQYELFAASRKEVDLSGDDGKNAGIGDVLQTIRASYVDSPNIDQVSVLAERLLSLYELPPAGAATKPQVIQIADKSFSFDPARWGVLVRNAQASALVAGFLRHDAADTAAFFARAAELTGSAVQWNATNDGSAIFLGRAEITPTFARAGYDKLVREPVQKLERAIELAGIPPAQKEALKDYVKKLVRSYAVEYKRQLRGFYDSFRLSTPSAQALRVAVSQMAIDESPYGAFLHALHRQVDVDTNAALLNPMQQELREYAGLRQLFDQAGAEGEVRKYRAILAQLLQDLGSPADDAPSDEAESAEGDLAHETLERALSQAGRAALISVRGDKGSYANMIREWHASLGLHPVLLGPFLAPIFELERIGLRDTGRLVSRAWNEQVRPDVQRLQQKFPFDTHDYAEDAAPQEIDALLNPTTGRIFTFVRRYLAPLTDPHAAARFHLRDVFRDRLDLPPDMLSTIDAAEALTDHLYDGKGRAAPLSVQIATVPFEHGIDPRFGLTLVYLSVGEASINNFNQKPGLTTVRVDWTREQTSQVGIQLMNLDSDEKLFPEPLATPSSSWSLLHLLAAGKATPVKKPDKGQLYTWQVRHQPGGSRTTAVRFVVIGNPSALFTLGAPDQALAWGGGLR